MGIDFLLFPMSNVESIFELLAPARQPNEKSKPMKKENLENNEEDTMRPEYDFDYSKAVWGKHAQRLIDEGSNTVVIQPDIFKIFPDSASVNDALRKFIAISKITAPKKATPRKRRSTKAAPKSAGAAVVV